MGAGDAGQRNAATASLRRRPVVQRVVAASVIVARPEDGAPVLMEPTAACVWEQLGRWRTEAELDGDLEAVFPSTPTAERTAARREIVAMLLSEGLLERR